MMELGRTQSVMEVGKMENPTQQGPTAKGETVPYYLNIRRTEPAIDIVYQETERTHFLGDDAPTWLESLASAQVRAWDAEEARYLRLSPHRGTLDTGENSAQRDSSFPPYFQRREEYLMRKDNRVRWSEVITPIDSEPQPTKEPDRIPSLLETVTQFQTREQSEAPISPRVSAKESPEYLRKYWRPKTAGEYRTHLEAVAKEIETEKPPQELREAEAVIEQKAEEPVIVEEKIEMEEEPEPPPKEVDEAKPMPKKIKVAKPIKKALPIETEIVEVAKVTVKPSEEEPPKPKVKPPVKRPSQGYVPPPGRRHSSIPSHITTRGAGTQKAQEKEISERVLKRLSKEGDDLESISRGSESGEESELGSKGSHLTSKKRPSQQSYQNMRRHSSIPSHYIGASQKKKSEDKGLPDKGKSESDRRVRGSNASESGKSTGSEPRRHSSIPSHYVRRSRESRKSST